MKAVMTKTLGFILAAGMLLSPASAYADPESTAESSVCSETEYTVQNPEKGSESGLSQAEVLESSPAMRGGESSVSAVMSGVDSSVSATSAEMNSEGRDAEKMESDQDSISRDEGNPDQSKDQSVKRSPERQEQTQDNTGRSADSTAASFAVPAENAEPAKNTGQTKNSDSKAETITEEKPETVRRDYSVSDKTAVGADKIVLDLSCRKRDGDYYVVTDRWQNFTEEKVGPELFEKLENYCRVRENL